MCIHKTPDGACEKLSGSDAVEYCVEGPCPYDTPTHADRIRAMSDEELAVFFAKVDAALYRADLDVIAYRGEKVNENLDWLRQPCEEANDGPII